MSTDASSPDSRSKAVARVVFGQGGAVAGVVYGTIVAMATLTAAYADQKDPRKLAVVVAATAVVLWVAHLYAHGLAESLSRGRRLGRQEVTDLARRELGILLAAVLPVTALLFGALDVVRETDAVWLAFGVGLLTLAVEGLRYARLERLTPGSTLAVVGANLALGLVVVVLKVALAH